MRHEYKIALSAPAELAGATTPVPAFEKPGPQAGTTTAAATVPAGATNRLAQAAARTPDAALESLAAATRQAQANAGAASQPMAGLANAPDDLLAKLPTGFGVDFQAKIIDGVEEIGHVFTEALQRGLRPSAEKPPAAPGVSSAEDRSGGSTGGAAQPKDVNGESTGRLPAASRTGPDDPDASADALERRPGTRREIPHSPSEGDQQAGAPPPVERRTHAVPAAAQPPDADRAARRPGLSREHARRRPERGKFVIEGYHGDGDPGGGLHTGGLTTGSLGGVGTSTAAGVLAGAPSAADMLAGRSLEAATPATGLPRDAGLAAGGVGSFPPVPTAAAGLGPALAGIGAPPPTAAAPGAPAGAPAGGQGGQGGAAGPATDKIEAAAGRGFEEAARAMDRLHATLSKGFQTLNERLERVEQTTREHTSQISNRA